MKNVLGIIMILTALVLAIAPAFTDCESHGRMVQTAAGTSISMKCHWAGVAEIAAAVPLGLAGIYALVGRRRETLRFAGIVGAVSGILAVLLPTLLIGTCGNAAMPCNVLMKPTELAAGAIAIAASLILALTARDAQQVAVAGAAA